MRRLAVLAPLVLATVLAACSQAPRFPDVSGTWSNPSAQADGYTTLVTAVTLDLQQSGEDLSGSFTLADAYGDGVPGVGEFEGTVTTEGEISGELLLSDGEAEVSELTITLDVTGELLPASNRLSTLFESSHTINCGDTQQLLRIDTTLERSE